jgi:hypothetical protein
VPARNIRIAALDLAARVQERRYTQLAKAGRLDVARAELLDTADALLAWVNGVATMTVRVGAVVDQTTRQATGTAPQGDLMQLHDNEQVDVSVSTKDAKGFETPDEIAWSVDNGDVVSLVGTDDGTSKTVTIVAGVPGSAVVTVTDGVLSATLAVDVVPGGTATIGITEGTPVEQPTP